MNKDVLRYPIGKFRVPEYIGEKELGTWISELEVYPERLQTLVSRLGPEQLDTPYRPGGWTVRQVLHHLYDSHTNSYIRFKWTLTENTPVIKAYEEGLWAALEDSRSAPASLALQGLQALHAKWIYLLRMLTPDDLSRTFVHPESGKETTLTVNVGIYAWHSEHHYMHIYRLLERRGWLPEM